MLTNEFCFKTYFRYIIEMPVSSWLFKASGNTFWPNFKIHIGAIDMPNLWSNVRAYLFSLFMIIASTIDILISTRKYIARPVDSTNTSIPEHEYLGLSPFAQQAFVFPVAGPAWAYAQAVQVPKKSIQNYVFVVVAKLHCPNSERNCKIQ